MTNDKQEKLDEQMRPLYAELQKFGQTQDWDRALKVTRKILGISSSEKKATQCKIVCLMQTDKFDDALTTIVKNATENDELIFERAYCEYRLNRFEEARQTLKNASRNLTEREEELLAQILFKLENYAECVQIYRSLLSKSNDEFYSNRKANFIAALATWKLVDPSNEVFVAPEDLDEENYDNTYNSACVLLSSSRFSEAEVKLRKAEAMCRKEFEEDGETNEEEVARETANIRVQLAFCLQQQNKTVEALTLYNDVLKSKPTDLAVIGVASNNLAVLNRDQNLFDSRKKLKTASAPETEAKFNSFQKKIVQINEALLAIVTGQHDFARKILEKFPEQTDETDETIPLAKATLLFKEKKFTEAADLLKKFLESDKKRRTSFLFRLTFVQLLLAQGKVKEACEFLRSDQDLQIKPAIVASLVTLYNSVEDSETAARVLDEAVTRLSAASRSSKGETNRDLLSLIKQNIFHQEKQQNEKRVTEMLEILHKINPNDTNTLSRLIVCYLKSDPERANLLAQKLPSLKQLAEGVDVDSLEVSFGKRSVKTEKPSEKSKAGDSIVSSSAPNSAEKKQKKKRKRKIRLPKNFDPNNRIDPERWLPLRDRTYYREKRGKRAKQAAINKGTQGASSNDPSASSTITTTSGGQKSTIASKKPGQTTGSTSTQPKPSTNASKTAAQRRKGRR